MNWRVVELVIKHSPSPILERIFDCGDQKNEEKRYRVQPWIGSTKDGEELRSGQICKTKCVRMGGDLRLKQ